jgi:hypothetical protein
MQASGCVNTHEQPLWRLPKILWPAVGLGPNNVSAMLFMAGKLDAGCHMPAEGLQKIKQTSLQKAAKRLATVYKQK